MTSCHRDPTFDAVAEQEARGCRRCYWCVRAMPNRPLCVHPTLPEAIKRPMRGCREYVNESAMPTPKIHKDTSV